MTLGGDAGLIKLGFDLVGKGLRLCRIWWYKKLKRPPIPEERARAIAYGTLGEQVERAISYRNMGSKKNYIAVSFSPREDRYATRIAILEQVGESYRTLWKLGWPMFKGDFEAEDIDNDGIREVIIKAFSGGTGAHSNFLIIYSQRNNVTYTIMEHTERQDLARPIVPEIRIDPEPPSELKRAIESCAVKRGFFKTRPEIDWDDVSNATPRWHRDNGPNPDGKITVVFYDASMRNLFFSASITATLDDGKILWTSYFKNPLVGYIKDSNKWFIAYSPSNFYNWACSLTHDGKRLWFGVHTLKAIYSFEFNSLQLHKHSSINSIKFEMDSEVSYKDGRLHVNDSVSFAQEDLEKAIQEKEQLGVKSPI